MLEIYPINISSHGRIVIPVNVRSRFDLNGAGKVILQVDDNGIHLKNVHQVVAEAQDYFTKELPSGTLVSEELIHDRRQEPSRE